MRRGKRSSNSTTHPSPWTNTLRDLSRRINLHLTCISEMSLFPRPTARPDLRTAPGVACWVGISGALGAREERGMSAWAVCVMNLARPSASIEAFSALSTRGRKSITCRLCFLGRRHMHLRIKSPPVCASHLVRSYDERTGGGVRIHGYSVPRRLPRLLHVRATSARV